MFTAPPPSRLSGSGAGSSGLEPAWSSARSSGWVSRGLRCKSSATAPLTIGAAIDVPAVTA